MNIWRVKNKMQIHSLPSIKSKRKKRVGRGYGSGKGGHTSGRGQKGQKVRARIHPLFEGTKVKKSLVQRLPLQRGKGKLKPLGRQTYVINVSDLNKLPENSLVTRELLVKTGILKDDTSRFGIKILGQGVIQKRLVVNLPVSSSAARKIKQAEGSILAPYDTK